MMTLLLTVITGAFYPATVTVIAQLLFPHQANGSLIEGNGGTIGSELIGQNFSRADYFHPRPSAAGTEGYDAAASGGSNLGPTSRTLASRIDSLVRTRHAENPAAPVPIDLVTASASGLDPDITPAAAEFQIPRVAHARGLSEEKVRELVRASITSRQLGVLGEPRVNVLQLNRSLERFGR